MGAWISRQKKTDDGDYEKILSELDSKLQNAELKLSEIKIRERRINVMFVLYGFALWAVYLAYCFATLHNAEVEAQTYAIKIAPVVLIPVIIYFGRRGLKWFYTRKQTNEESNVASLRAQQKLKVEELKKKTAYYTTKSLLERYDESSRQKAKQPAPGAARPASGAIPSKKNANERDPNFGHKPSPMIQNNPLLHKPPQQNMNMNMQQAGRLNMQPPSMRPTQPAQREWYDKLVDAIVGEDGPETKYALICNHCSTHNGLVLPQEIETIQYVCPKCGQFNPSRRSRQLHPGGPVLPPGVSPAQSRSTSPKEVRSLSQNRSGLRDVSQTRDSSEDAQRRGRSTSSRRVPASSNAHDDGRDDETQDEVPDADASVSGDSDTIASRVRLRKRPTSEELEVSD
ncbi:hypothetical protein NQZ79_g3814 [Umbelopsis isabellina]|nr:hypothetical protein NQZ79_g3814 [Umbelopsis isabellina]